MFEKEALIAKLKEKEISVSELAEKIGINKATLYRKIVKKSDFTLAEIQKCAEIFGENSAKQAKSFMSINSKKQMLTNWISSGLN